MTLFSRAVASQLWFRKCFLHFPHRLFLNHLYKDEYAADKAKSAHNIFGQSNIFYEEKRNKSFFLLRLIVPQYCVCCHDSSRPDLALSAAYSSLYKLFRKSLWENPYHATIVNIFFPTSFIILRFYL